MATALYADVHVPGPVILQLRLRGVNIAAATEEGHERKTDEELLDISTASNRVMVTQDIRFRVLAEDWQRTGRSFAGLVFAPQRRVSFGEMIRDLELIAEATDPSFWINRIEQLPLDEGSDAAQVVTIYPFCNLGVGSAEHSLGRRNSIRL